jgi:hypothetical protein
MRSAAVALAVALAVAGCASVDSDPEEDARYGAFTVCTKFVEDRLKSPGSASFRNYFEDDGEVVVAKTGDSYSVLSTVDSENSFGANIRTSFLCVVEPTGGDNWRLVSLELE